MKEQDATSAASMQSDPDASPSVGPAAAHSPEAPEAAPLATGPPEGAAEQRAETFVEENVPVIDIHPPAHGGITRRDFFVHLFIVVLGILIAIGLEQGVEYIHHRQELAEARRELAIEYKINLAVYRTQRAEFGRFIPILQRNIAIFTYLRAHPGAARSSWPGEFSWYHALPNYVDATWKSLQGTETLALMPQADVQRYTTLYEMFRQIDDEEASTDRSFLRGVSYGLRHQDPASMTPAQLDDATQSAADMLGLYAKMSDLQINLNARFKDFVPAPSYAEMRRMMGTPGGVGDLNEGVRLENDLSDEIGRIQGEADSKK
jgi:hypothetical protein